MHGSGTRRLTCRRCFIYRKSAQWRRDGVSLIFVTGRSAVDIIMQDFDDPVRADRQFHDYHRQEEVRCHAAQGRTQRKEKRIGSGLCIRSLSVRWFYALGSGITKNPQAAVPIASEYVGETIFSDEGLNAPEVVALWVEVAADLDELTGAVVIRIGALDLYRA